MKVYFAVFLSYKTNHRMKKKGKKANISRNNQQLSGVSVFLMLLNC